MLVKYYDLPRYQYSDSFCSNTTVPRVWKFITYAIADRCPISETVDANLPWELGGQISADTADDGHHRTILFEVFRVVKVMGQPTLKVMGIAEPQPQLLTS